MGTDDACEWKPCHTIGEEGCSNEVGLYARIHR
jgi:hypothetical protein